MHRSRSVIASLLFVCVLGLSSFSQPQEKDPIVKTATVKHIGYSKDNYVFQVLMDNEAGEKFSVTIKDATGAFLFFDVFYDKKFDKRFLFNKEEGHTKLNFIIRSLKDNQTQTFEINTSTRVVENYDITVRKL